MHLPVEWTKKWAYDHPGQALCVLAFGAVMTGFAIWLAFTNP